MKGINGRAWGLRVERQEANGLRLLTAAGRISGETAQILAGALEDAAQGARRVVLDLASVDYISGAGLEAIRQTAERLNAAGGELTLRNLQDPVRITVELSGLTCHSAPPTDARG